MSDEPEAQDQRGEDARLAAFDERLKALREREDMRKTPNTGAQADESYRLGNRVLAELIAGIGGGAFIGWTIDQLIGRGHWGLLVVMGLGTFAAFRNIIRISTRRSE